MSTDAENEAYRQALAKLAAVATENRRIAAERAALEVSLAGAREPAPDEPPLG